MAILFAFFIKMDSFVANLIESVQQRGRGVRKRERKLAIK